MTDYDTMRECRRILFDAQTRANKTTSWERGYQALEEGTAAALSLLQAATRGRK